MGKIKRERYDDYQDEKYQEDRRSVRYEENRHEKNHEEDRRSVRYEENRHEKYSEEDRRSMRYEDNRPEKRYLKRGVSSEERHAIEILNSDNSDNENTASSTDDSESSSSESEDSKVSNESEKRKRYKRKKAKIKKEKHYRASGSAESDEYEMEERGRHRKRKKIVEEYEDVANIEDKRHRSRSHKRKHKHKRKHRRRRHYGSEERSKEKRKDHGWGEDRDRSRDRRGRSLENVDSRKEEVRRGDDRSDRRQEKERRRDKREDDRVGRRGDREDVRHERRENRRAEEQENRSKKKSYVWNPSSRWDDEEETAVDVPDVKEEVFDDPSRFIPGRERKKSKVVSNGGNAGNAGPPDEKESASAEPAEVWGKPPDDKVKKEPEVAAEDKEKPSLALSGKLSEDTNTYNGVVIKYSQPTEARKPKRRWRWYIFKGDDEMPFLPLHRQSAFLIGRDRKIVDIPSDHPSCSKQHAVLQYRLVSYIRQDGTKGRTVKPYILDLESANGTFVNNKKIEARRYYELQEKDCTKFGFSSREYVLLHEGSKDDEAEEDAGEPALSPVSLLRQK